MGNPAICQDRKKLALRPGRYCAPVVLCWALFGCPVHIRACGGLGRPVGSAAAMSDPHASARNRRSIVEQLRRSQIYRDYERAFRDTTGLPLALRALESFDLPHRGDPKENPFCALMSRTNHTCSLCLQPQRKVEEEARLESKTLRCFAGMCDSAVPVRVGENLIAFLQTGQILLHQPSKAQFTRATRALLEFGAEVDLKQLEEAYFQSRVVKKKQYESIVRLLTIFAQHLATMSNQLMVQEDSTESPAIARARVFIAEHQAEELSLSAVARAVSMSPYYFCKSFRKATG